MFTRITSILQQAVDAFAPDLPLKQEFVAHWKAVTQFYVDKKDFKLSIEQTPLPGHISRLVDILINEEVEQDGREGAIGSCMEYMLQHRILETLYSLARTDCPAGMKQLVLQTFTRLLSRIAQPTLPHISVYRPVLRLVRMCGEMRAAPFEVDEVIFLCTLCAKIKDDPYLVNFFIETSRTPAKSDNSESVSSSTGQRAARFSIVESLCNLLHSEDARVRVKACEGLMLIASLPDDVCAYHIVNCTNLTELLTGQLCTLYNSLPKVVDPGDIETVDAKWGLDNANLNEDGHNFAGKRPIVSFLSWLDFCDQFIDLAHPSVGKSLASNIRLRLLNDCIEPAVLQTSESAAITATAYLCRCLYLVTSSHLLSEFVYFILGDDTERETLPSSSSPRLRQRIIERCDHISDELCKTTWKLIETLLQKPHRHIVHSLVLRNLQSSAYLNSGHHFNFSVSSSSSRHREKRDVNGDGQESVDHRPESVRNGSSGSVDVKLSQVVAADDSDVTTCSGTDASASARLSDVPSEMNTVCNGSSSGSFHQDENGSIADDVKDSNNAAGSNGIDASCDKTDGLDDHDLSPFFPQFSPSADIEEGDGSSVQEVVQSWLSLMPEDAKTSCLSGDTGYDMYLRDAEQQCRVVAAWYNSVDWPSPSPSYIDAYERRKGHSEESNEMFYEGAFLRILLDKLSHLLHQNYEVNLHVTSVISCLSTLPHEFLHDYLLNPSLDVKPGVRTVYSVMNKVETFIAHLQTSPRVSAEIRSQLMQSPDLPVRLLAMRRQLNRSNDNSGRLRRKTRKAAMPFIDCSSDATLLAGIIVFEEFCKELAAIAFVKHFMT